MPSTFWATQQPDYDLLRPHLRQAEELFQARPWHCAQYSYYSLDTGEYCYSCLLIICSSASKPGSSANNRPGIWFLSRTGLKCS